jgi:hypothetical protein
MQHFLGGTSLTISFKKVGDQCLVGDVSTGVLCPVVPTKYQKIYFSICIMIIIIKKAIKVNSKLGRK